MLTEVQGPLTWERIRDFLGSANLEITEDQLSEAEQEREWEDRGEREGSRVNPITTLPSLEGLSAREWSRKSNMKLHALQEW